MECCETNYYSVQVTFIIVECVSRVSTKEQQERQDWRLQVTSREVRNQSASLQACLYLVISVTMTAS